MTRNEPPRRAGAAKEPTAVMNVRMEEATSAGVIKGKITVTNTFRPEAPMFLAASIRDWSILFRAAETLT